ncbi:unnamed protein product, partial [Ixodes pacificus]
METNAVAKGVPRGTLGESGATFAGRRLHDRPVGDIPVVRRGPTKTNQLVGHPFHDCNQPVSLRTHFLNHELSAAADCRDGGVHVRRDVSKGPLFFGEAGDAECVEIDKPGGQIFQQPVAACVCCPGCSDVFAALVQPALQKREVFGDLFHGFFKFVACPLDAVTFKAEVVVGDCIGGWTCAAAVPAVSHDAAPCHGGATLGAGHGVEGALPEVIQQTRDGADETTAAGCVPANH